MFWKRNRKAVRMKEKDRRDPEMSNWKEKRKEQIKALAIFADQWYIYEIERTQVNPRRTEIYG